MMVRRDPVGLGMTSQRARDRMVEQLRTLGIQNPRVLDVMRNLSRHLFVDEGLEVRAYENSPLPIGQGQTISQPYIVARMTEHIVAANPQTVLEIGTGSGYQAAVLSYLVPKVYSVERIESLLRNARRHFRSLGIDNVRSRHDDGRRGWPEEAPFDAIIVTAAGEYIDPLLAEQLAPGGVLIAPVGPQGGEQKLIRITRDVDGLHESVLEPLSFVPLLGGLL
ncbi:MAG: protein-L-isoaspartate(D-aspartate) O-methyltransferase [Rhodanobacteraceae bacterium]|nr:protein-L-isoaspartate(D-aspartate) O-methyltransferase [Rhodanobacteraceae bacterium]